MSWTQVTSKNQQALQNALMYSGLVNPPAHRYVIYRTVL